MRRVPRRGKRHRQRRRTPVPVRRHHQARRGPLRGGPQRGRAGKVRLRHPAGGCAHHRGHVSHGVPGGRAGAVLPGGQAGGHQQNRPGHRGGPHHYRAHRGSDGPALAHHITKRRKREAWKKRDVWAETIFTARSSSWSCRSSSRTC